MARLVRAIHFRRMRRVAKLDGPHARVMTMNEIKSPFGVYVHWPFCAAKCPYCDFNSHVRTGALDETGWAGAIEKELDWIAAAQGEERPLV